MATLCRSISILSLLLLLPGCGDDKVQYGSVNAVTTSCEGDTCVLTFNLSLRDLEGRPVQEGLEAEDFEVPSLFMSLGDTELEPERAGVSDVTYEITEASRLNVAMLLDQSGSMSGNDPDALRFDAARTLTEEMLVESAEGHSVALLSFPWAWGSPTTLTYTSIWQPFTQSSAQVNEGIDMMSASPLGNSTPLYSSIAETCDWMDRELEGDDGLRTLVVMTDGKDYSSSHYALETALENDVRVYIVGLGENLDQEELRPIAESTGGLYIPATDDNLDAVFAGVSGAVYGSVSVDVEVSFASTSALPQAGNTYDVEGELVYDGKLTIPFSTMTYVSEG